MRLKGHQALLVVLILVCLCLRIKLSLGFLDKGYKTERMKVSPLLYVTSVDEKFMIEGRKKLICNMISLNSFVIVSIEMRDIKQEVQEAFRSTAYI
jgi:hypothetical protein